MPEEHPIRKKGTAHQQKRPSYSSTGAVFVLLSLVLLCFLAVVVHPDSHTSPDWTDAKAHTNLVGGLDVFSANSRETAFDTILSQHEEHSFIPEGALAAPVPDVLSFGETYRPRDIVEVIEDARDTGLLGKGETTVFSLASVFPQDSPILYYFDSSLLAVSWQEIIDGHLCTFCEVRVSDASQFRRKFSQDRFAASVKTTASDLAVQANAVVAMNADNVLSHELGIAVYQRELCRMNRWPYSVTKRCFNAVDTLLIDGSGNFRFSLSGTPWQKDDLERFLVEHNIVFSLVNGPALIIGGEAQELKAQPLGSLSASSTRAAIAQCASLHYLYCSVGDEAGFPGCTAKELTEILLGKKVEHAYALAGGQTAELIFDGQVYSPLAPKSERPVGDILYFATALSDKGVARS
ncbi:MAG: phosphodiester glycosidase family protein [Oscillospiraceae bacterium]|nr:phosphodiester glycosidase family protein [Oscillospiraceae bacterium]